MPTPEPRFADPGRPENEVPLLYDGPWYADIRRIGRWRYEITYCRDADGLKMQELRSDRAWGHTHADNKARRKLNRWNRPVEAERWTVRKRPHPVEPPEPPPGGSGVTPPDLPSKSQVAVVGVQAAAGKTDERPPTFGFSPRRDLR
jgi:hypothetical protein